MTTLHGGSSEDVGDQWISPVGDTMQIAGGKSKVADKVLIAAPAA